MQYATLSKKTITLSQIKNGTYDFVKNIIAEVRKQF